jgi:hypothetical protein
VYASVSEIGDAENSRILRLALLAPNIVETILAGSADQSLMLERLERPLPASWKEQIDRFRMAPLGSWDDVAAEGVTLPEPFRYGQNY